MDKSNIINKLNAIMDIIKMPADDYINYMQAMAEKHGSCTYDFESKYIYSAKIGAISAYIENLLEEVAK